MTISAAHLSPFLYPRELDLWKLALSGGGVELRKE